MIRISFRRKSVCMGDDAMNGTYQIEMINARLAVIQCHIKEQPNISVTYFLPDEKKAGGRYVTVSGNVKMLDGIERAIIMADRTKIPIGDVRYIEGNLF